MAPIPDVVSWFGRRRSLGRRSGVRPGGRNACSASWPPVRCPASSRSRSTSRQIEGAHECFVHAIGDIDILLDMLGGPHTVLGDD
ncbi:hypothetical protein [Nonomuraea sp. SYSU D8015]|uniref:hypothetical protein n=1 Tax=Nonomuraea sp. SYSU D8015 TaxID=2593644 RepID=UPI0016616B9E|nr:hypothetical protein [Nonomuraea sp. SYSU D8015]